MSADLEERLVSLLHAIPPATPEVFERARTSLPTGAGLKQRRMWRQAWLLPAVGLASLAAILTFSLVRIGHRAPPSTEPVGTATVVRFAPADGWQSWTSGPVVAGLPQAVTATRAVPVTFDRPPDVRPLDADDILVWATLQVGQPSYSVPLGRQPARVAEATRQETIEGVLHPSYLLRWNVAGQIVEFRVFFGRNRPTGADFARADAALARTTVAEDPVPPPRLGVLERPATDRDHDGARAGWRLATAIEPASLRFIRREAEADWFAGRTPDGRICLLAIRDDAMSSSCVSARSLSIDRVVALDYRLAQRGQVTGVLGTDAVTGARALPVGAGPTGEVIDNLTVLIASTPGLVEVEQEGVWRAPLGAPTSSALRFSVLEHPPDPRDALPEPIASGAVKMKPGLPDPPVSGHWALTDEGGQTFWVVEGSPGQDLLCLVSSPDRVGCAGVGLAEAQGALVGGPGGFAGIAPDGYDTAEMAGRQRPISNNVYSFPDLPPDTRGTLTIRGPAGVRSLKLGP